MPSISGYVSFHSKGRVELYKIMVYGHWTSKESKNWYSLLRLKKKVLMAIVLLVLPTNNAVPTWLVL